MHAEADRVERAVGRGSTVMRAARARGAQAARERWADLAAGVGVVVVAALVFTFVPAL